MTVRPVEDGDAGALAAWAMHDAARWQTLGFSSRPAQAEVYAWLARFRLEHAVYVVCDGDRPVGAILIEAPTVVVGIVHILIAPEASGQGIAIARAGLEAAPRYGWPHLAAAAAPHLPAAVHARWLRRVGFTVRHYGEWRAKETA